VTRSQTYIHWWFGRVFLTNKIDQSPEAARGFRHGSEPDGRREGTLSDRSHLTVLKPTPLNARQEAFARNIAEGRRQREAYRSAGYTPTSHNAADANASRLIRDDKVQSRVRELQAMQAQASQITAERLLAWPRRWAGRSSILCHLPNSWAATFRLALISDDRLKQTNAAGSKYTSGGAVSIRVAKFPARI